MTTRDIFNEDSLEEAIIETWGRYGAHYEVWSRMRQLASGPTEVRYKMADGTLVGGEFGYVGETEFFDDCDEPVELIRETIVLVQSERYTHISDGAQLYLDCLAEAEAMDAEEGA